MKISIATAISEYNELAPTGNGRGLWYMPEDLLRFKAITRGHVVLATYETWKTVFDALGKPMPERTNIVITDKPVPEGVVAVSNFEDGVAYARKHSEVELFLMGDADFYHEHISFVDRLYLTAVDGKYETGFSFPDYKDFTLLQEEKGISGKYTYVFKKLERK